MNQNQKRESKYMCSRCIVFFKCGDIDGYYNTSRLAIWWCCICKQRTYCLNADGMYQQFYKQKKEKI